MASNVLAERSENLLVLVRGLPGAGKTKFSRKLTSRIEESIHLNPDEIEKNDEYRTFSKRLGQDGVSEVFHPYRYLRERAVDGLRKGGLIVWEQPWSSMEGINITVDHLRERVTGEMRVLIVDVDIEPEEAWRRVKKRLESGGHGPDKQVFNRFVEDYCSAEELPYDHLSISGSGILDDQIERALESIDERSN
jgi:hypothetical protein